MLRAGVLVVGVVLRDAQRIFMSHVAVRVDVGDVLTGGNAASWELALFQDIMRHTDAVGAGRVANEARCIEDTTFLLKGASWVEGLLGDHAGC